MTRVTKIAVLKIVIWVMTRYNSHDFIFMLSWVHLFFTSPAHTKMLLIILCIRQLYNFFNDSILFYRNRPPYRSWNRWSQGVCRGHRSGRCFQGSDNEWRVWGALLQVRQITIYTQIFLFSQSKMFMLCYLYFQSHWFSDLSHPLSAILVTQVRVISSHCVISIGKRISSHFKWAGVGSNFENSDSSPDSLQLYKPHLHKKLKTPISNCIDTHITQGEFRVYLYLLLPFY